MTNRVARSFAVWSGSIAGVVVGVLIGATPAIARVSLPDKACSLLTDAEITAAVAAPTKATENQMPVQQGAAKGETMRTCSWSIPNGAVNLSFVKVGDMEAAKTAFRAQMQKTLQSLKTQGWTIEEKPFGDNESCWTGTPPANAKDTPRATGCAGSTNGVGISVGITGSMKVDADAVKKLLDAAMKRLG
jgi:hypothetical protein